jgi:pimeloyl-ACP methyl ester carboxylesterase
MQGMRGQRFKDREEAGRLLAGPALPHVKAPALLIVGGDDVEVIRMNRDAYDRMTAVRRLEIVPGASHLFEEPGTLETVAGLAREWFVTYLIGSP